MNDYKIAKFLFVAGATAVTTIGIAIQENRLNFALCDGNLTFTYTTKNGRQIPATIPIAVIIDKYNSLVSSRYPL